MTRLRARFMLAGAAAAALATVGLACDQHADAAAAKNDKDAKPVAAAVAAAPEATKGCDMPCCARAKAVDAKAVVAEKPAVAPIAKAAPKTEAAVAAAPAVAPATVKPAAEPAPAAEAPKADPS